MPAMSLFLLLAVKIAGAEFVPKDLVFAAAESRSRATAEGPMPGECKWDFVSETRIGRREDEKECVRFYYKTSVSLVLSCMTAGSRPERRFAERITATEARCPDASGRINPPAVEARAISSGTTVDGRSQEIVVLPDGTRAILSYDAAGVVVTAVFPDGTVDTLKFP
jgi:hypothetical protein